MLIEELKILARGVFVLDKDGKVVYAEQVKEVATEPNYEAAIKALASTFGNLPERDKEKPDYSEERQVSFPAATSKVFGFNSEIPKGMAVVHWPTTDIFDIKKTRRLSMLSSVLDDRLRIKIREELGDHAQGGRQTELGSLTQDDHGCRSHPRRAFFKRLIVKSSCRVEPQHILA